MIEQLVSHFKNTSSTEVVNIPRSIESFLEGFKTGEFKETVDKVRGAKNKGEKDFHKLKLPSIAFHGIFDKYRKKDLFIESNGIIIIDIDECEDDLEDIKEDIVESSDNVVAVFISPGGKGIKALHYITPELVTADNYRAIGKQVSKMYEQYGKVDYLSVTDTLIATYDPKIRINENAVPDFVYIKDNISIKSELEERDETVPLWEDVEDFFDTALANQISQSTNNNFHYIQVAILDLAKFGFYHPEHDLSFVVDYAEEEFGSSGKNKERLESVAAIAKDFPQTKWPYRLIPDEEEDVQIDYSQYQVSEQVVVEGGQEDVEDDGFVNYSGMFDKVIATAKEGNRVGYEISYTDFADIFRPKGSGILTVTGIPTSGKTEAVDAITLDLARLYGHQTLVAGYEQSVEEHILKLMRRLEGKDIRCKTWLNESNFKRSEDLYSFVVSKFIHVDTFRVGGNVNNLLEMFSKKILQLRKSGGNPRYVVVDPFNLLSVKAKLSGHEKVEEILRRLNEFSHKMDVLVILVAHPFKMKKDEKTGEYDVPDFYSIKGSSAFFEVSYHGIVIHRKGPICLWRVLKVKQNNMGTKDEEAYFLYDRGSGRYIPCDEDGNEKQGTHRDKDWLEKALTLEKTGYKKLN